jgi:hypothetical protein
MEGSFVAGAHGVAAAGGPFPNQLSGWSLGNLLEFSLVREVLPYLVDAKRAMNVPCPAVALKTIGDSRNLGPVFGDASKQEKALSRTDFPAIFPKAC